MSEEEKNEITEESAKGAESEAPEVSQLKRK